MGQHTENDAGLETTAVEKIKPIVAARVLEGAFKKIEVWKLDAQEEESYCKENGTAD